MISDIRKNRGQSVDPRLTQKETEKAARYTISTSI